MDYVVCGIMSLHDAVALLFYSVKSFQIVKNYIHSNQNNAITFPLSKSLLY